MIGCCESVEVVGCPFAWVVVTTVISVLDTEFDVDEIGEDSGGLEDGDGVSEEEGVGEPWGEEEVAWDVVSGFVGDED